MALCVAVKSHDMSKESMRRIFGDHIRYMDFCECFFCVAVRIFSSFYYNNTSYVLGNFGNVLPAGSGMRRPKAQPEVCLFHFPRAINSYIFLKHMKYYFYYMFSPIYTFKLLVLFMRKIIALKFSLFL